MNVNYLHHNIKSVQSHTIEVNNYLGIIMFYQEIQNVLPLIDLISTARLMKMTQRELRMRIEDHAFTFEECCRFIRCAKQPTLLKYMMSVMEVNDLKSPTLN